MIVLVVTSSGLGKESRDYISIGDLTGLVKRIAKLPVSRDVQVGNTFGMRRLCSQPAADGYGA